MGKTLRIIQWFNWLPVDSSMILLEDVYWNMKEGGDCQDLNMGAPFIQHSDLL